MALSEQQKLFAEEYIVDLNATQAAIRAGYKENSARQMGSRLLSKVDIQNLIKDLIEAKRQAAIMRQDEVMEFLSSIARGNETEQVLRGEGQGFQVIDRMEVSMKDRIKAAELLGKRYSLFTDKVEHSGNVDLELVIDYGGDDDGDSTEEES